MQTPTTICVRCGSSRPITAASITAGCSTSADSTSNGPIRYALDVITSSLRPSNQKYPSSSTAALSPVKYQSPRNAPAVASGSW